MSFWIVQIQTEHVPVLCQSLVAALLQLLLHLDELRHAFVHLLDCLELRDAHPLPVADVILSSNSLTMLSG